MALDLRGGSCINKQSCGTLVNPMLTPPHIDAAIEELEALAPLLSAEVPAEPQTQATAQTVQSRAYKEALLTTRVLMEKLRVVRLLCVPRRITQGPCNTCDGD